jgi:hypothetical protein
LIIFDTVTVLGPSDETMKSAFVHEFLKQVADAMLAKGVV